MSDEKDLFRHQDELSSSSDEEAPTTEPVSSDKKEEGFSESELRLIRVIEEASFRAQQRADPVSVIIPPQEPEVFYGTYKGRAHWMSNIMALFIAPVAVIILWILFFVAGDLLIKIFKEVPQLDQLIDYELITPWATMWIPLILGGASTLFLGWLALPFLLEWFYHTRRITDTHIILRLKVPGFIPNILFNVDDYTEQIHRGDVTNVKIEQTGLGEFFGYGTVKFETNVQSDNAFQEIRFFKNVDQLYELFSIERSTD
jgi:hypothetical protein